jgi:tetratricopeptide (TPR) repeat protein
MPGDGVVPHVLHVATAGRATAHDLLERGIRARARADYAGATALLGEAVALAESARPPEPRLLAAALNALGMLCKDVGRYDEGRACYERAMRLLTELPGASPHDVAALYHNLAGMLHARGDYAGAEPVARRGLALRLAAIEPCASGIVADMIALAGILEGLGRYEAAATQCGEALALLATLPAADALAMAGELAVALNNLGAQRARQGRYDEAMALMERALDIKRRLLAPDHPDVALTMHNIATVWMRRGDPGRALPLFTQAHAAFTCVLGPAHRKTVRAAEALERCRGQLEARPATSPDVRPDGSGRPEPLP